MGTPRLAIAAGNQLSADAAAAIGSAGGNAVDACLAAAIMAWVTEPFMASLGGSGFIIVRTSDGDTQVFDGNNAMPLGVNRDTKLTRIFVPDYANGLYTGIGGGAVAVPGILAAIQAAWEAYGRVEWPALFAPAIVAARDGIGFPHTSAYYLSVTWSRIWSAVPRITAALRERGRAAWQKATASSNPSLPSLSSWWLPRGPARSTAASSGIAWSPR